ncbi:MAG TPA: hypothetical protein VGI12_09260 [Vicinamibacterales bacterium]
MNRKAIWQASAVALVAGTLSASIAAQDKPQVKIPEAGVPQIMTIEGLFVRAAYNNEGYVILGYKTANYSIGDDWMLIETGMTLREGVSAQQLKREAVSLDTPDGTKVPLPTVEQFRQADTQALQARSRIQRDSINYFPPMASRACRIGFFSDVQDRAMPWDEFEISPDRACVGRLYFKVPGGIKYGQYWLNVQLEKSLIRVPFRILTKEEEKFADKNYGDIRKQVKEAFAPKKKDKDKDKD